MKKLLLAAAFAATSTATFAGTYSEPVVEPVVIIEDTASSSSHAWVAPVMFILIMLALGT